MQTRRSSLSTLAADLSSFLFLGSGWPVGNTGIDFSRDTTYLSALGSKSQGYMATVSPAFYTRESFFDLVRVSSCLLFVELTSRSRSLLQITLLRPGTRTGFSRVTSEHRCIFEASKEVADRWGLLSVGFSLDGGSFS